MLRMTHLVFICSPTHTHADAVNAAVCGLGLTAILDWAAPFLLSPSRSSSTGGNSDCPDVLSGGKDLQGSLHINHHSSAHSQTEYALKTHFRFALRCFACELRTREASWARQVFQFKCKFLTTFLWWFVFSKLDQLRLRNLNFQIFNRFVDIFMTWSNSHPRTLARFKNR